jgi:hypothetical protein
MDNPDFLHLHSSLALLRDTVNLTRKLKYRINAKFKCPGLPSLLSPLEQSPRQYSLNQVNQTKTQRSICVLCRRTVRRAEQMRQSL